MALKGFIAGLLSGLHMFFNIQLEFQLTGLKIVHFLGFGRLRLMMFQVECGMRLCLSDFIYWAMTWIRGLQNLCMSPWN